MVSTPSSTSLPERLESHPSRAAIFALLASVLVLGGCPKRVTAGPSETPCDGVDSPICDEQRQKKGHSAGEREILEREASVDEIDTKVQSLKHRIKDAEDRLKIVAKTNGVLSSR
jgi:hypothetical protein